MRVKTFLKTDIAKIFYIYLLSNIFLLLNYQGIYWDDWTLYNVDNESMLNQFKMNGGLLAGYMHSFLSSIGNGIFVYRLLVFIAFFLSGVFIYKILVKYIPSHGAFWIVLLYLTVPLNSSKIALINTPAMFLLFLFFAAFYMLSSYLSNSKPFWYRILILVLFFISFFLNSLLVFYAIVLMYILYVVIRSEQFQEQKNKLLYLLKAYILKYSDFILLPILFYIIKSIYFVPYGAYANYNKIAFSIKKIIIVMTDTLTKSIFEPIVMAMQTSLTYWYLTIIVFLFLFLLLKKNIIEPKKSYLNILMLLLGAIFYTLAVFPYAVVGKLPQLEGWESRHQILIPLGLAFMLYGLISSLTKIHHKLPTILFLLLISTFVVQDLYNGYRYIKDWHYQVSLEENFKSSIKIQKHTTFVGEVNLEKSLANGRKLSFYEQNGRLKKVFNEDTRLMVSGIKEIEKYKKYKKYKQYNFSSWEYQEPVYLSISKNILLKENKFFNLKLLYNQMTDETVFHNKVKQMIKIDIRKDEDVKK